MNATDILKHLKKAIKNHSYDMVPTLKNRETKRKYGLTQIDIEDIIISLQEANLYKGPEIDRDYPNDCLFIFKKEILPNVIFYIKVKLKNKRIKILSCHEDE